MPRRRDSRRDGTDLMSRSTIRRGVAPQFSVPVTAPKPVSPQAPQDDPPENDPTEPATSPTNIHPFVKPQGVVLDPVTVDDVDRLWDWVRADKDGTSAFLGATFENSRALFTYVEKVAEQERNSHAAFYAIREPDALLGFVLLWPIFREQGKNPVATTHVYLEPESRGRLSALLPMLMAEADRIAPSLDLRVVTTRSEWATMLQAVGFESHLVLTRTARTTHGS